MNLKHQRACIVNMSDYKCNLQKDKAHIVEFKIIWILNDVFILVNSLALYF